MPADPPSPGHGSAAGGTPWPARLRRLVLATSVPPLLWLYRSWYALARALVVRRVRRFPSVVAVYVRGGGGRGELIPLVSDLDFVVVVRDAPPGELRRLRGAYAGAARLTRVLDPSPVVIEEEQLRRLHAVPRRQVWIAEGKATWRLVHGRDVVAALPDLHPRDLQPGLLQEMRVWWARFDACAIRDPRRRRETVALNVIGYKAVSEMLGLAAGLEGRPLVFSRAAALDAASAHPDAAVRDLRPRLERVRRRRFLGDDPGLADAAKDVLIARLDAAGALLERLGSADREPAAAALRVDAPLEEWAAPPRTREHVEDLRRAARAAWGSRFHGAQLATGACFDLDEWALGLRVDPSRPPPLAALRDLHDLHETAPRAVRAAVHPYLLLGDAALQLDADERTKSERAVLFGPVHPEVFELFSRPELGLEGRPEPRGPAGAWTPLAADATRTRADLFLDLLQQPDLPEAGGAGLAGVFRKALQLVLIGRSAERGGVVYPLTSPAIRRELERQGVELPPELAPAVAAVGRATRPADRWDRPVFHDGSGFEMLAARARAFLDELRGAASPAA
jgi:predicted nucleotidyltransferase